MMSNREVIFQFNLMSHQGVKMLLVGALCRHSLTKVLDQNDRKCKPTWKLLGMWKIHSPCLMAVYKKACKLNIRFCRSDLNFLPLLKILLPRQMLGLPRRLLKFYYYWNPLYPNPSINADDFIGVISATRISWLDHVGVKRVCHGLKRREAPCLAKSSHS